jgi:hypothetical protein
MVYPMTDKAKEKIKMLYPPSEIGSYNSEDCIFVLKDISHVSLEKSNEERELNIQSGMHYSTMLPFEYQPSREYLEVFHRLLLDSALPTAKAVANVSKKIIDRNHRKVVLVSLARAGSPAGALIKRYIKQRFGIDCPHYSISIIRDIGIDENALLWILQQHPNLNIQFVDGWTGKGVINQTLEKSLNEFFEKYGIRLPSDMAVIADPAQCVKVYGTRDDFLIPSACLNSTVSGLVSRTVYRKDLIKENDFHGAKYYQNLEQEDVSNLFIDTISNLFDQVHHDHLADEREGEICHVGMKDVLSIKADFNVTNINHIKPGVGETTRVLLRRVPWKILVKNLNEPYVQHALILARERNVEVMEYYPMIYNMCGIIKDIKGGV